MKESTKIIFFNIFRKSFDPVLSLITKLQPQKVLPQILFSLLISTEVFYSIRILFIRILRLKNAKK